MDQKLSVIKILKFYLLVLATPVPFFNPCGAQALKVVKKVDNYHRQVAQDSSYQMLELKAIMPTLTYDLRYATPHNFTGQRLYKRGNKTYLRRPAARALASVQQALQQQGLDLKIFDAYRPYAATQKMWELIKDERYVANPAKGSGHNRGLAVDLTLVEQHSGRELDMGTGFDNFTDSAHHTFQNLPEAVLHNRTLLRTTMEAAGFKALETEWWHYYWPNDKAYEVLDLDFKKLKKK